MGKVADRNIPGANIPMKYRISRILPFLAAAALLAGSSPASALEHPGSLAKRLLAPRGDGSVAVIDRADDVRRQREIYRILCGGAAQLESGLSEHLCDLVLVEVS